MDTSNLTQKAAAYLHALCLEAPHRRVGSQGNRLATDRTARALGALGWHVDCPEFACLDWLEGGARLTVQGEAFDVQVSPHSPGCRVEAPLTVVGTVQELEQADLAGRIALVHGDLAREQLMPKNFPFYNPEEHQRIIGLLEAKAPAAIVAATGRNPSLAGGVYPFPLIEDGDIDIPSVYMTEEEGQRLAARAGQGAVLVSEAARVSSTGCNVLARRGDPERRVVVCAQIDTKGNTPGALDNASGVIVLLLLAELLAGYQGEPGIEIFVVNGEDHYSASGEVQYLQRNAGRMNDIRLVINVDGIGHQQGETAFSLYGCSEELAAAIRRALSRPGLVEGSAWYQGDHSVFFQQGRPAVALTSDDLTGLMVDVTHTPQDRPDLVDPARLLQAAEALRDLFLDLGRYPQVLG